MSTETRKEVMFNRRVACEYGMFECDLCGCKYPIQDMHVDIKFNHLCPYCRQYYETLPDVIRDDVDRFMDRNLF